MMNKLKALAILTATSLLVACGGGGGGDSSGTNTATGTNTSGTGTSGSTNTSDTGGGGGSSSTSTAEINFPIFTAWKNRLEKSQSLNYTISGTVEGVPVTGSGTETVGVLAPTSFNSQLAKSKTIVFTGTISGGGATEPFGGSATNYYDENYKYLGSFDGESYCVVTGEFKIPQAAKINDAGTIYTENCYTNSAKSNLTGTNTVAFALQSETSSTAILKLIQTERNTRNEIVSTAIGSYRINLKGEVQELTEEYNDGVVQLTYKY